MKLDNVLEIKAKEYYDKCESIVKNKRTSQDEYDKLQPKLHACETLLNVFEIVSLNLLAIFNNLSE